MKHLKDNTGRLMMILFSSVVFGITGCQPSIPEENFPTEKPDTPVLPDTPTPPVIIPDPIITSFILKISDNPQLEKDVAGEIDDKEGIIYLDIEHKIDDYIFTPSIKYPEGVTITPGADKKIDAEENTSYTVNNGKDEKIYKVAFSINSPIELKKLALNGTNAYYNEQDGIYHIPVHKDKWNGSHTFTYQGAAISEIEINGTTTTNGSTVNLNVEFGNIYDMELRNKWSSKNIKVEFIGLPIFSVKANFNVESVPEKWAERSDCEISVYDPTENGKYQVEKQFAGIRKRGGSSSGGYEKRPFSVEFRDRTTREEQDVQLFGLRSDGDWILDAVATDVARVRNRIATDLWNDMHKLYYSASEPKAVPATRGQFVEFYFNDEYRGIYCITERVDRKQLKLDKTNGYLYKAEGWCPHVRFESYDQKLLPYNGKERWEETQEGFQAEYPETFIWDPLVELVKFICDNDDRTLALGIDDRFDLNNLADYLIFINVTGTRDNASKNSFLGVYNRSCDKRFFYAPWDLDATFGRSYDTSKIQPGAIVGLRDDGVTWDEVHINWLMRRLARVNGAGFGDKVKQRWSLLKTGLCSKTSIMERFSSYQELLEGSGAYKKERNRWPGATDLNTEIQYIDGWMEQHLRIWDDYISNWDNNTAYL